MNLTELRITTGTDILSQTIAARLQETPIQSVVFRERRFIDHNTEFYNAPEVAVSNRIAMMVRGRSEPKNIMKDGKGKIKQFKLQRSKETDSLDITEVMEYDKMQALFMDEWIKAHDNKVPFLPSNQLEDMFNKFKSSEMFMIGLRMHSRQFFGWIAKHASLISTGKRFYQDAEVSNTDEVNIDWGIPINTVTIPWSQTETATPLQNLDKAFDAMRKKNQNPTAIFMGAAAAEHFERNTKEVYRENVQPIPTVPFVTNVQSPSVVLTRSLMDVNSGYRQVGSYRGIPIYCISKEVLVPLEDGTEKLVEIFDTNAVSIVSQNSEIGGNNFVDVFGNLSYFSGADNNELTIIRNRQWFAYLGGVSDDKTRKSYYCESRHIPVLENKDALFIYNVA